MINYIIPKNKNDFEAIKKGDFIAIEWKLDNYYKDKKCRFAVYEVYENKSSTNEIILQKKNNVYFNYSMFLNPEIGISNAKNIVIIKSEF